MLDANKIIEDTRKVFAGELEKITNFVSAKDYKEIHTSFMTPTSITLDTNLLLEELKSFSDYFMQWGKHHSDLPRYGLALVNLTGFLYKDYDPINGSLYEWNSHNPDNKIIESDCIKPTPVMDMSSLQPLRVLNEHWCRSNILKWNKDAEFVPHIDNCIPAPWLRLWATTDVDNLDIRFYNKETSCMESVKGLEAGRIYIIDTSIVHDAKAYNDNIYQLFLATLPSSVEVIKSIKQ